MIRRFSLSFDFRIYLCYPPPWRSHWGGGGGGRVHRNAVTESRIGLYSQGRIVRESYGKIIVNPPLIAIAMKPKGFVSEICV